MQEGLLERDDEDSGTANNNTTAEQQAVRIPGFVGSFLTKTKTCSCHVEGVSSLTSQGWRYKYIYST